MSDELRDEYDFDDSQAEMFRQTSPTWRAGRLPRTASRQTLRRLQRSRIRREVRLTWR